MESKWELSGNLNPTGRDPQVYHSYDEEIYAIYGDYATLYVESEEQDAKRITALLNGDLAAACGMTREELIRKMVERFYGPRDHPVMDDVLDLLGQLIRGETKP